MAKSQVIEWSVIEDVLLNEYLSKPFTAEDVNKVFVQFNRTRKLMKKPLIKSAYRIKSRLKYLKQKMRDSSKGFDKQDYKQPTPEEFSSMAKILSEIDEQPTLWNRIKNFFS